MNNTQSSLEQKIELKSLDDTKIVATSIATSILSLPHPCCLYFNGGLGVGKTTLIRLILRSIGIQGNIPSPTYTLVEEYIHEKKSYIHTDLYRITDDESVVFLGLNDYQNANFFIEWPQKLTTIPIADMTLNLDIIDGKHTVDILVNNSKGNALYENMKSSLIWK